MMLKKTKMVVMLLFLAMGSTTLMAQVGQNPVSEEEMSQFAITFQKMRMMNQEMQMEMTKVVSKEGLEVARFNKIHTAKMDPNADIETTEKEEQQYQKILTSLEASSAQFQEKMETLVQESGLSIQRYEQIANQLQSDQELQARLKAQFEK